MRPGQLADGKHRANAFGRFEMAVLSLYALLLGIVSWRHEMWADETQAWLLVRDSRSLGELFSHLHYEGHPAVWFLLLYIPAHLSGNPVWMQGINYGLAVFEAGLIVTARPLARTVRALAVFCFFLFYDYGVVARNYMVAALLLTAAMRCLVGDRARPKFAIVLLALAMNSHVFAIPVAGTVAIWMFGAIKVQGWRDARKLLRDSVFWLAFVVLAASVAAAYLTIRPPADVYTPQFGTARHSLGFNFLLSEGKAWQTFVPVPEGVLPHALAAMAIPRLHPVALGSLLAVVVFALAALTLRSRLARSFFVAASMITLLAMAVTVHLAPLRHYGFLLVSFLLAHLMDGYRPADRKARDWLGRRAAFRLLVAFLAVSDLPSIYAGISDFFLPYSEAKETSAWLVKNGLSKNPLVMEQDDKAAGILAYLERPLAYYPACRCYGSFTVWNMERAANNTLTSRELDALDRGSALPVVVISGTPLPGDTLASLRLKQLAAFSNKPMSKESYFVYERPKP